MKSLFFALFILAAIHLASFSQALSGNYSIGGATSDYATFGDAVQSLKSNGVDGPVVFSIEAGTYEEQIRIPQIQGASAVNTITFQSLSGDSADVVLQYKANAALNNYVVGLDTTSFITIKNISIVALDTLYGCAVSIGGGSQYVTLDGNVIQGNGKIYPSIYSLHNDYLTILNNLVLNGQSGIYLMGEDVNYETANTISNNIIVSPVCVGVYARYQWRYSILNNRITHTEPQEEIWAGISLVDCQGNINNKSLVANNMISCNTTILAAGIEMYNSNYQLIYHNSILMYGNSSQSRSFDQESGGTFNEVKNNIFSNEAGGIIYYIENTNSFSADNNVFFSTKGSFAYYNDFIDEFAQWKSATNKDLNSCKADPNFVSQTDLHTQQKLLTAKGASQTLVLKDIDGEMRDTIRPTPGADRLSIACGGPLAGGYAIGPGGDYTSFSEAVLALESCGISAPVTFYVTPGTYTEQVELSYIRYGTEDDSIKFISQVLDSSSVTLQYDPDSLQNYVVNLNGVDNVSFEYITFKLLDTVGRVIVLEDTVNNIAFTHDCILGASTIDRYHFNACVFFLWNDDPDSLDVSFSNTLFRNGSYGIYCDPVSGYSGYANLMVSNNRFIDQRYGALFFESFRNTLYLTNNIINSTYNPQTAIDINYSDSAYIAYNRISLTTNVFCIGIESSAEKNLIANNFISIHATGENTTTGCNLSSPGRLFYNSILCTGGTDYYSLAVKLTGDYMFEMKNNNIVNLSGEVVRLTMVNLADCDFDHNNYYTPERFFANVEGSDLFGMQDWIASTGLDHNSVAINPHFTDMDNLYSNGVLLNNKGVPLPEITNDIYGSPRDPVTPDIGAVEFDNPVFNAGNDTVFCYNEGNGQYGGSHMYDIGYGYDSYSWSDGSDSSSIRIDSLESEVGNNHYTVTVTTGGNSYNDDINIVYDLPDPIVQPEYCHWHDPLIVTANPGYSWLWSTGDTTQSIAINEGNIFPEITVTDQYGCKNSETLHVKGAYDTYYANLNVSDTTIGTSQILELTANNYDGTDVYDKYNFRWNSGSTMQDMSVDASKYTTGGYEFSVVVYLTDDTLCASSDTAHVVITDQLGIEILTNARLNFYPNPAKERITIESDVEIKTVEIYNLSGQFIESKIINANHYVYDISTLSEGTYILKIVFGTETKSVKLQVE